MRYYNKTICIALLLSGFLIIPLVSSANPFDLYIVPTVDQQLDSWTKIPSKLSPTIFSPKRIYPYQPFSLRLLFKDYALTDAKNAHISYDVQFFDPEGKPTADRGSNLLAYNGPIKNANSIIINQQLLSVFFDNTYPFGEYEIKISARDHHANTTIARSGTIEFAPFRKVANFASLDYFSHWIMYYFREPDVADALHGFLQFYDDDPAWLHDNRRLVAFTNQLLDDNPWVWAHLSRTFEADPDKRDEVITLMAINNHPIPEIVATFDKTQKNTFEKIRGKKIKADLKDPTTGKFDKLWGEFYARGNLAPIEQIVKTLKPFDLSAQPAENFTPGNLEKTAFWSLVEHGQKIPLATKYYAYLFEHGQIKPMNKIQLKLALEVIAKALSEQDATDNPAAKKNPLSQ